MANGQLWEIDSQGNKKIVSGLIPVTEADEINFDNSNTDLQSTDVQGAIEELTSAENIAYDSNNSVKDMIDSEQESLITGLNISRSGKNRILHLNITPSTYVIHTLATKDRPIFAVTGIGRYKNTSNTYYPCLITLDDSGNITASYFNGTNASAIIDGGTIVGNISYMTN